MRYTLTNITKTYIDITDAVYSDAACTTRFGKCQFVTISDWVKFETTGIISGQYFRDGLYNKYGADKITKKLVVYIRPGVFLADTDTGSNDVQVYFKGKLCDQNSRRFVVGSDLLKKFDWPESGAQPSFEFTQAIDPMYYLRGNATIDNDINIYDAIFGSGGSSKNGPQMNWFWTDNKITNLGIDDIPYESISQMPGKIYTPGIMVIDSYAAFGVGPENGVCGALSYAEARGSSDGSQARDNNLIYMTLEDV